MEVMPGYKQTEVGVIPEDWDVAAIGIVAETSSGATPSRALADRYYRNGHFAWVKTLDLNNSEIYYTGEQVTQAALNETSLRCYSSGSVVVAMYGGFNQIGRTGLLRIPATVNQALTAIRPDSRRLRSEYLLNVLNFRVDYWKAVASSSRKDPNITSKDIRDFPLALPGVEEQEAIAEALSDVDVLIESLEQLLVKKRQIKQGAMQELLTGKKRLPGFSGEWEVKPFGEVCWFQEGPGVRNSQFAASGIKLLNGTNIFRGVLNLDSTSRFISEKEAYGAYAHFLADAGDIVIASSGIIIERFHEKVAFVREFDLPFCMNTSTIRFKPLTGVYIEADEPRKISPFDKMSLLDLIVKTGIANAIATQLGGLRGNRNAIAETIENNVRRKIIKEHLNDPAFYEKMSALLDEIIAARKAKAIEYEEYLRRIAELAKRVEAGQAEDTPEQVNTPGLRALYNNLNKNRDLALKINDVVKRVRPDGWRGIQAREQVIKGALYDEIKDEAEVERIFLIIKQQREY